MAKKGEKVSQEVIEKYKIANFCKLKDKYNWELAELYWDIIPAYDYNKNKLTQKRYISLREYKQAIDSGKTHKNLINDYNVQKHLLGFYSNFLQGKIKLSKEVFENDYKAGLSPKEISQKYNVTDQDMGYLREFYGIKRSGPNYRKRKKEEIPLSQRQKEILYGTMMGDGKRQTTKSCSVAGFKQGTDQVHYLLWKFEEFKNVSHEQSLKITDYLSVDTQKPCKCAVFYTKANSDIEEILTKFYKTRRKANR